ncbi:hypothetical protein MAR_010159 [Mya arenaria]|uniref:TIR domain-containing protein n=1 Tax=Mya arenaria TaxID=6604 RepID=A0ABY7E4Z4_MYAAR|nr:hypothetical protein MAR_010159 [Mya arenaria]
MITLRNNSFRCDCTTGWMKEWLLQHEAVVSDWLEVMCVDNNENSVQLISVPDKMFACVPRTSWSVAQHVVMPSTILGSLVIVITVCSALIVIFRKTIKKCLENRDTEMVELEGRVLFDAHTNDEEFVSENITGALEEKGITTSLVDYEFIPGTDIRDEIFGVLQNARSLIFVLSQDTLKDEHLMYRLSIAITVALTRQDNFLLICTMNNLDFNSRYLTSDVKTFLNNFVYLESEDKNLSHRLWEAITFSNEKEVGEDRNIWHNGENNRLLED